MKWLNIIISVFIFGSCVPDMDLEPRDTKYSDGWPTCEFQADFDFLWQKPIAFDSSGVYNTNPSIFTEKGILNIRKISKYSQTLVLNNVESGEVLWEINLPDDKTDRYRIAESDGVIILSNYSYIYAIDINSGTFLWDTEIENSHLLLEFVIKNDYVYYVSRIVERIDSSSECPTTTYINVFMRTPLRNFQLETIYTDIFGFPALSYNTIGELIAYIRTREGVKAYSLSQETELWVYNANFNIKKLIVNASKLFILNYGDISCVDINTGIEVWRIVLDSKTNSVLYPEPMLIANKLIVRPSYENLYAIDIETGNILWHRKSADWHTLKGDYHCKTIFITDQEWIFAFDLDTGNELWKTQSPNCMGWKDSRESLSSIGVSVSEGYFLFQDRKRLIVGKIPESLLENCEDDDELSTIN